jgi:hypothetical protein
MAVPLFIEIALLGSQGPGLVKVGVESHDVTLSDR